MNVTPKIRWVWVSSEDSRAAGIVSVMAMIETLICVALYWALWLYWGVTWHHWMILIATPLVLMRSKLSLQKGVDWFDGWSMYWTDKGKSAPKVYVIIVLSIIAAAAVVTLSRLVPDHASHSGLIAYNAAAVAAGLNVAFLLYTFFGMREKSERLSTIFAVVGIALLLEMRVMVAVFAILLGWVLGLALFFLSVCLGIWLRAFIVRVSATFRHPILGAVAIPRNWVRHVLVIDFRDPPELIPGHLGLVYGERISLSVKNKDGTAKDAANFVFDILGSVVFYLPALLWRWSIKSTAWFYLPLLWVGRGWQRLTNDALLIWGKSYCSVLLNKTGFILATTLLFVSAIALFVPAKYFDLQATLAATGAPMTSLGWAFVLDWPSLAAQPWQWFYLPSWCLTLMMFFMVDRSAKEIAVGAMPDNVQNSLRFWMWVGNLRVVLTNIGLGVALWYFLAAVGAWEQVKTLFTSLF